MKGITLISALILAAALPATAKPTLVFPTESEFIRYEYALSKYFREEKSDGIYVRKSDYQRRLDGQVTCSLLTEYTVKDYLRIKLGGIKDDYKNDRARRSNEFAYLINVTAAAIDNMCSENRGEFIDYIEGAKQQEYLGEFVNELQLNN